MKDIFHLMHSVLALKEIDRTGWNKKFSRGGKYKNRRVIRPESVADHSFGTAMLVLFVNPYVRFNKSKALEMALIHDLFEAETGDIVTTTLSGKFKNAALKEKRLKELKLAKKYAAFGGYGKTVALLWHELDRNTSKEARIVNQLDKLEMDFQAVYYKNKKQKVDSEEFISSNIKEITNPILKKILIRLKQN